MGNLPSASFDGSCQVLATVAMSKYMSLSKPQVLAIRDQAMLFPSNMKLTELHRSSLNAILNHAKVLPYPDQDIINLLFTLWISNGYENQVDCIDLCIGMSILACPNESFEKILNFALVVLDAKNSKMISVKDATRLSQCMNTMAIYLGDKVFREDQINRIVSNVFDTMTLISMDSEDMSHAKFHSDICTQPMIRSKLFSSDTIHHSVDYDNNQLQQNQPETCNENLSYSSSRKSRLSSTLDAVFKDYTTARYNITQKAVSVNRQVFKPKWDPNTNDSVFDMNSKMIDSYTASILCNSRQKTILDNFSTFDSEDEGTTSLWNDTDIEDQENAPVFQNENTTTDIDETLDSQITVTNSYIEIYQSASLD